VNKVCFQELIDRKFLRFKYFLKQKSSSGVRRAFNMMSIGKLGSDLSVPPAAGWNWHLAPLSRAGCQGFTGPLPSAFLDKQVKELRQR
jgi:hypothetical protein